MRDFHACIGKETRRQAQEKWGGLPDIMVACVGGGSNAMGLFHEFVEDEGVRLIGVEAGECVRVRGGGGVWGSVVVVWWCGGVCV